MAEPQRPALTPRAEAARLERQAREAAVLRDNLLRRKQQARARSAAAGDIPPPEAEPRE